MLCPIQHPRNLQKDDKRVVVIDVAVRQKPPEPAGDPSVVAEKPCANAWVNEYYVQKNWYSTHVLPAECNLTGRSVTQGFQLFRTSFFWWVVVLTQGFQVLQRQGFFLVVVLIGL